jgi:hypothetical protein
MITMHQRLTYRIDRYANTMISQAERLDESLTVEQKVTLLNALGKWVAIKNKLIDGMEGERLDEFRNRLKQGDPAPKRPAGVPNQHVYDQRVDYEQKSRAGRKGMAKRWGLPDPELTDGTGAGLAEFKKRIPRADDRDQVGNHNDAGGISSE